MCLRSFKTQLLRDTKTPNVKLGVIGVAEYDANIIGKITIRYSAYYFFTDVGLIMLHLVGLPFSVEFRQELWYQTTRVGAVCVMICLVDRFATHTD